MTASTDEQREELARRLPNVIRVAAGMVANPDWTAATLDAVAKVALGYVLACERVCGIGADDD